MVLKHRLLLQKIIGALGTLACLVIFILHPSFPTPDKLMVVLVFIFMILNQAWLLIKRLGPFVILTLVYEQFRGLAHALNNHVNFTLAPNFDKAIFGKLPTTYLQNWLWRGHTSWYDYALYLPYLIFFVVPISLAILVWKTRDEHYWRVVTTYLVLFFGAFLTFLLFPAAPPWMASDAHYIPHIVRISSYVWAGFGIHNFPSVYNHIAANPVAAVPSLHSGVATLFAIFVFKLYGRRWGALALLYPLSIYLGVVYEGEHYVFDVLLGIIYAAVAYFATPYLMQWSKSFWAKAKAAYSSSTKSASKSAR